MHRGVKGGDSALFPFRYWSILVHSHHQAKLVRTGGGGSQYALAPGFSPEDHINCNPNT